MARNSRFIAALLGLALVPLLLTIPGCLSGTITRHQKFIDSHVIDNPDIEGHDLRVAGFNLHYRSIGQPRRAVMIWIHGTPGGWSDIGRLMVDPDFTDQVRVVSVDRPGWGDSRFGEQIEALPSFDEQIRLLLPLLTELRAQHPGVPIVLAGHSWGAPLVASIAARADMPLAGVLALSGPFDPDLATPRWYNRAARMGLIKAIIGSALRRSNVEMYALPANLRESLPEWRSMTVPLVVVQGESDQLVPYGHFEFAQSAFPARSSTFVSLADQGHLLQIQRTPLIARCVLAIADGDPERCDGNSEHSFLLTGGK